MKLSRAPLGSSSVLRCCFGHVAAPGLLAFTPKDCELLDKCQEPPVQHGELRWM